MTLKTGRMSEEHFKMPLGILVIRTCLLTLKTGRMSEEHFKMPLGILVIRTCLLTLKTGRMSVDAQDREDVRGTL